MRLRTFTDYCLRVLIYLAVEPERRATTDEIATAFSVSGNHLDKVVRFLARHGLLASVRGRGGGLRLASVPAAINVGEVVRLAEGGDAPVECHDRASNACVITPACRLRHALDEAVGAFYGVLAGYTLADLVQQRRALAGILGLVPGATEFPLRRLDIRRPGRRGGSGRRASGSARRTSR
jgi:Rrf2 family nitric oxide-sensitive transcriptional repressor